MRAINPIILYVIGSTLIALTKGLPSPLIYGGEEAIPGEFPYLVSLQGPKNDGSNGHTAICGGTLVGLDLVVTAAHCLSNLQYYPPYTTRIVAGAHRIYDQEESQQIVYFSLENATAHHQYNKLDSSYDIAVIKIHPPFRQTERVIGVQLPSDNAPSDGICQIVGWGTTGQPQYPNALVKAEVPIVSKSDCGLIYPDTFRPESQICAGLREGGVDTCFGDTGGPLICSNAGPWKFFAGISSAGFFCGRPNHPGVYTEVSRFINWILNPNQTEGTVNE